MREPTMTDLLALIDGAINRCEDRERLENFAKALRRLAEKADSVLRDEFR
jgi:hypothetical protein